MQDNHRSPHSIVSLAGLAQQATGDVPAGTARSGEPGLAPVDLAGLVLAAHLLMLQEQGVIDGHGFDALARALDAARSALATGQELSARPMLDALVARVDSLTPPELAGAATLGLAREEWLATIVRL
ncbi:MAG: hypothetical protein ACTHMX_05010, partial [Thermomicrobiales bacterium]